MSDEQPGNPGAAPDDERVRSLLADVGAAPEALPADVVARLDETLTGLVAEREAALVSREHTASGEVVPLRPRWMPRVAAAAAAIIVLGLGGITAANLSRGGDSNSTTSSGSAGGTALQEKAPSASAPSGGTGTARPLAGKAVVLSSAAFARDVRSALKHQPALRGPAGYRAEANDSTGGRVTRSPAPADAGCRGPAPTDGATVTRVLLDSAPAALVVHPQRQGHTLVEAWSCDGSRRLASATVTP